MDSKDATAVVDLVSNPVFSPDGKWLSVFSTTDLLKVPVDGGSPISLAKTSARPAGAAWGVDGTIVFATTEGLFQVSQSGGEPRLLATPDRDRKERLYAWPHFLPGGRSLLFTVALDGAANDCQIALLDLKTLQRKTVLERGSAAQYAVTGHLVYATGQTMKMVAFDPAAERCWVTRFRSMTSRWRRPPTTARPTRVVRDRHVGVPLALRSHAANATVDRSGGQRQPVGEPGPYGYPRVSPDGSRVALDIRVRSNRDIWILTLDRLNLTRLTDGPTEDLLPVWSRDGQRVFFASDRTGNFDVYSQAADGASEPRVEFAGPGLQMTQSMTPDGTQLIVDEESSDTSVLDLESPGRLVPLLHLDAAQVLGTVSPDGHWIAYESDEAGGQSEIFVRPFPQVSERREKVSRDGGRFPFGVRPPATSCIRQPQGRDDGGVDHAVAGAGIGRPELAATACSALAPNGHCFPAKACVLTQTRGGIFAWSAPNVLLNGAALVTPVLVLLAVLFVSANPTALAWAALLLLVAMTTTAAIIAIARRQPRFRVAVLALNGGLALVLTTYCASSVSGDVGPDVALLLPPASPPPGTAVYRLPTGLVHRTAAFAYRGGSLLEPRDFAMMAVLVRHARGDLLIDTGFGRRIDAQVRDLPALFGAATRYERGPAAVDQLAAVGYDRGRLRGILLTHAHWDHASGLEDFPETPVLVSAEERRFIDDGGWITALARSVPATRYTAYAFHAAPYLGFEQSYDIYGDGAVVVVPAPGHTPGSVVVFVTVANGARYAFLGDLAWQLEGVQRRQERPWLMRLLADVSPSEVRQGIHRIAAIGVRFPAITLVPAHDGRAFAQLPELDAVSAKE